MTDPRLTALLRALRPGQTMWLSSAGKSLWPLVLSGDSLRVVRCEASELRPGDVAVVDAPGTLIAHVVVQVDPVVTASVVGVVDPPHEVLGRVDALRRGSRTVYVPRAVGRVLSWAPRLAVIAKRSQVLRFLVRRLRD